MKSGALGPQRPAIVTGPLERRHGLTLALAVSNGRNSAHSTQPARRTNLAAGFFAATPGELRPTNAFLVRSLGTRGGELCTLAQGRAAPTAIALAEAPYVHLVTLRERGAVYYAASSVDDPPGAAPWPEVTPVGIDGADAEVALVGGVHQLVHGERGYRAAAQVYGVEVLERPEPAWPGWAPAEPITPDGAGWVWRELAAPAGLVHAAVTAGPRLDPEAEAGLVFRAAQSEDGLWGWRLLVSSRGAELAARRPGGRWALLGRSRRGLAPGRTSTLTVLDQGARPLALVDGAPVAWAEAAGPVAGSVGADAGAAGRCGVVAAPGADLVVSAFEAQPRRVAAPAALAGALGLPPTPAGATRRWRERFDGEPGALDEPGEPPGAAPAWRRSLGLGVIERTGGRARVRASAARPNPGRTVYTTAWPSPDLADLELAVRLPGQRWGEGEACRAGLAFWQDPDRYALVSLWLDDSRHHAGGAVTLHVVAGGREAKLDAAWANVGAALRWGKVHRLRAGCDGRWVLVRLDGRAVLARNLDDVAPGAAPLRLARVGVAVNEDWGNDTGTELLELTARG